MQQSCIVGTDFLTCGFVEPIDKMQTKRLLIPALFTAIVLHSLCCLLPFLPLALGTSSTLLAVAGTVSGYQTWIIVLQILLLGIALYRAYRPSATRSDRLAFWLPLLLTVVVSSYTWLQHEQSQRVQQQTATFGVKRFQNINVK